MSISGEDTLIQASLTCKCFYSHGMTVRCTETCRNNSKSCISSASGNFPFSTQALEQQCKHEHATAHAALAVSTTSSCFGLNNVAL